MPHLLTTTPAAAKELSNSVEQDLVPLCLFVASRPSRFTRHASRFTLHVSRFTFHASRFTHHASRFTFHPILVPLAFLKSPGHDSHMKNLFTRRNFLRTSTLSGSALLLLPRARLALAYD